MLIALKLSTKQGKRLNKLFKRIKYLNYLRSMQNDNKQPLFISRLHFFECLEISIFKIHELRYTLITGLRPRIGITCDRA